MPEPLFVGSFKKCTEIWSQHTWGVLFKELTKNSQFHPILQWTLKELKKYPPGMLWSNLCALFERTHKEWLRHMLGTCWTNLQKNPVSSFKSAPSGYLGGYFSNVTTMWPPVTLVIKVMSTFQKWSQSTPWVMWVQVYPETTKNPQSTHWVCGGLPPVSASNLPGVLHGKSQWTYMKDGHSWWEGLRLNWRIGVMEFTQGWIRKSTTYCTSSPSPRASKWWSTDM